MIKEKKNIIIDCDPGHDDAIAILLALAHQEAFNLLGITTVAGNTNVKNATSNALKILELTKHHDIPVAKGYEKPIVQPLVVGLEMHGESGMDGPILKEPSIKEHKLDAVSFIAETLQNAKEKSVTICTMGPLTNIAMFIKLYPELTDKIEKISIMGGGILEGNRLPVSEFNIYNDPEAAQIVFDSGIDISLFPLDVTHQAQIYPSEFDAFSQQGEVSNFVKDLLEFFAKGNMEMRKFDGCPMHDSCAVLGVLKPDMFEYIDAFVTVEMGNSDYRGLLVVDYRNPRRIHAKPNVKVAVKVDREQVFNLILESAKKLDHRIEVAL